MNKTEIDSISAFVHYLRHWGHLRDVVVQGLDLTEHTEALCEVDVRGAVFLGGRLDERAKEHVLAEGATIFPGLPHLPYRPYRPSLYDVEELFQGYQRGVEGSYGQALDSEIYRHFDQMRREPGPVPVLEALAQCLHDHAIEDALHDLLYHPTDPRKVVAIMGGHALARTDPAYAQVARIARALARRPEGYLLTSGGGPGAMEATHLGAWMSEHRDEALDEALEMLSPAPTFRHPAWFDTAFEVRDRFPSTAESLGIPTWFYGHEPPNLFARHIAKYFSNSLREDGLLAIATYGVIYAPGSAGTIQEVFMDAAQNHYGTFEVVSPMIFLGVDYWTKEKPVFPLLSGLAASKQYGKMVLALDDEADVLRAIVENPPVPYEG